MRAPTKMKYMKAAGLKWVAAEFFKKDGEAVVEWLKRIFNVCMDVARVTEDG